MATTLNDIIAQFSTATSDANKANQARFQAALDALGAAQTGNTDAYNQAFGLLDSLGSTSRQNISDLATKAQGAGTQNTISGGLFNTTMLDSILRDVAAKKESSLTELEQAIAGQKSGLLTAQAGADTNIAGLISSLYGSAFDNAPDASMWAQLATQSQSSPTGRTMTTRSNPLSDMTDTMSNTTSSSGVSDPREAVMVTGTPSGRTWGNDPQTVDNTPATPVNWDTALTPEDTGEDATDGGMSFDQWASTTSGDTGAIGQMADDMLGQLGLGDMSASDLLGIETPTEPMAGEDPDTAEYIKQHPNATAKEIADWVAAVNAQKNKTTMKPGQMYWDSTSHTWKAWGR
jgi:hypothetical protein